MGDGRDSGRPGAGAGQAGTEEKQQRNSLPLYGGKRDEYNMAEKPEGFRAKKNGGKQNMKKLGWILPVLCLVLCLFAFAYAEDGYPYRQTGTDSGNGDSQLLHIQGLRL